MMKATYLIFFSILVHQAYLAHSSCSVRTSTNGVLTNYYTVQGTYRYYSCWEISNPKKYVIRFQIKELLYQNKGLSAGNLTISSRDENKNYTFWGESTLGNVTVKSSSVLVHYQVNSGYMSDNYVSRCTVAYTMESHGLEGTDEVSSKAIRWLYDNRTSSLDWGENTLRALIALYLSGNETLDGTDPRTEVIVSRAESRISSILQRQMVSENELSLYINFLRVTCNSPRHFATYDLVQLLLNQLDYPRNVTHPLVYLTLCNAKQPWPQKATTDLMNVLKSRTDYLFLKDFQSHAIMAVSCMLNQTRSLNSTLVSAYRSSIANLKRRQLPDGSFGDIYETSVALQALVTSGEEFTIDWNSTATVSYLAKEFNSSSVTFQEVYALLPALNRKSLGSIANRNCSGHPNNNENPVVVEKTSKIEVPHDQVRYSLFIGDEKELIRTITFLIPNNFTAYQVMQMAEVQDNTFEFHWRNETGKMFVKEISNIANDVESGKFWILHLGSNTKKHLVAYFNEGPDKIVLKRGDHLIMWYKTVHV